MNINKVITITAISLAAVSSAATIGRAVAVNNEHNPPEQIGGLTVDALNAEIKDSEKVTAKAAELKKKADQQSVYDFYKKFYDGTTDLTDEIKEQRAKLKTTMDLLQTDSKACAAAVDEITSGTGTGTQKIEKLTELESGQKFKKLQTTLYQVDIDKIKLEKMIQEYEKKKAEEEAAAQRAREEEERREREKANQSSSGSSSKGGNSSGSSSSSSSGSSSGSGSSNSSSSSSGGGGYSESDYDNSYGGGERYSESAYDYSSGGGGGVSPIGGSSGGGGLRPMGKDAVQNGMYASSDNR